MTARALSRLLAALLLALACVGCRSPLVGLHDLRLVYAVTGDMGAAELHDRIVERLSAADLAADVDTSQAHEVSLRVDAAAAADVGRLLLWRGGVTVAVVDDEAAAIATRVSGATRQEVTEALSRLQPPAGHVFAIEPLANGLAKSRALEWPPVAEVDTVSAVAEGPRVRVPASPELVAAIGDLVASRPAAVLAITRGRTVLATVPLGELLDHDRLVIPFGTSITAYTEASDVAHLLATDPLPPLRELSHAPLPRDWLLAAANLVSRCSCRSRGSSSFASSIAPSPNRSGWSSRPSRSAPWRWSRPASSNGAGTRCRPTRTRRC